MTKYTPGPWKRMLRWGLQHILGANDIVVARCGTEANARIIAEALEMLACLESLLMAWPDPEQPIDLHIARAFHEDARAAIARAKDCQLEAESGRAKDSGGNCHNSP